VTAAVLWGALALVLIAVLVRVLVMAPRILAADERTRLEVERAVQADLTSLNPDADEVSSWPPWAPGTAELVELLKREHRPLPDALIGFSERSGS